MKSLFPVPKIGEPAAWLGKSANKQIRDALDKLQSTNQIEVQAGAHKKLGKFYYVDGDPKTRYYNIENLSLSVKKIF